MSDIDSLVPDGRVAREFGISTMTVWRWDRNPRMIALGWPSRVHLNGRNYRSRSALEAFKANVMRRGLRGGA